METSWDPTWCHFKNALHSAYREIRHIGPPGDHEARATITGEFESAARTCQANREALKSTVPYRSVIVESTTAYIEAYRVLTGLDPANLSFLFRTARWRGKYGGEKWAIICDTVIALRKAIDRGDLVTSRSLSLKVRSLCHNSGPLVPSRETWQHDAWQQQKWPELCEEP